MALLAHAGWPVDSAQLGSCANGHSGTSGTQQRASMLYGRLENLVEQLTQSSLGVGTARLALFQVWIVESSSLLCLPDLFFQNDPQLADFRASCQACDKGEQGMPARACRSGSIQVIQNVRIIPTSVHPRSRLPDNLAETLSEVVYVPVFDVGAPHAGPVAVLEALLSQRSTDGMLAADLISWLGKRLAALQLSLSSPLPQPIQRSMLAGRRGKQADKAAGSDSDEDDNEAAPQLPPIQLPKQQQQPCRPSNALPLHPYMQARRPAAPLPPQPATHVAAALAALVVADNPPQAPSTKRATEVCNGTQSAGGISSGADGSGEAGGTPPAGGWDRPMKLRRVASLQRTTSVVSLLNVLEAAGPMRLPSQSC